MKVFTAVDGARAVGFLDFDGGEQRQAGLDAVPEPDGDHFCGGPFQTGDIVEIAMVEAVDEGFADGFDICEVHDPSGVCLEMVRT